MTTFFDVQVSNDLNPFVAEIQFFVRSEEDNAGKVAATLTKAVAAYKRINEGLWRL